MKLRIKEIRETHNYTQAEIAKVLHCTQQTYSRYETGEIMIDAANIMLLADFYHTSVDYLLGLTTQIEPYEK
ncbi:MAG: helix-turn-helix transcriptional regulator [Clostridia bacterium]|jgi:transcriptional regulator with XRE-family HTH domain|nr:helix-turn-helix transcriptional regulator [Clostridia bacterium]